MENERDPNLVRAAERLEEFQLEQDSLLRLRKVVAACSFVACAGITTAEYVGILEKQAAAISQMLNCGVYGVFYAINCSDLSLCRRALIEIRSKIASTIRSARPPVNLDDYNISKTEQNMIGMYASGNEAPEYGDSVENYQQRISSFFSHAFNILGALIH